MPAQTTTSPLLGKLGGTLVNAHAAVKGKPAEFGNAQLPGGIENGVAELRVCKFGVYEKGDNKGKPFFTAMASVLAPVSHEGVKVQGLMTKIGPIPLCDTVTKGTPPVATAFAEHYQKVTKGVLSPLGFDVDSIVVPKELLAKGKEEAAGNFIEDALRKGMAMLVEKKTKTRFRTWKGKKLVTKQLPSGKWVVELEDGTGRKDGMFATKEAAKAAWKYADMDTLVNHEWNGAVEFSLNGDGHGAAAAGVQDDTEPGAITEAPPEQPAAADEPAFDDLADDLPTLAQRASDEDDAVAVPAQKRLEELSDAAGLERNAEGGLPGDTWEDLVSLIQAATAGDDSTEDEAPVAEEEEAFTPEVGAVYKYQQIDAAGKPLKDVKTKKAKKPIEVLIKSIDAKTRTCTVVDNISKKTAIKAVPFDDLLSADE